jgi:hypothetical protein
MASFWMDRPPLFVHRLERGAKALEGAFAVVDEGDEMTVVSTQEGRGAAGPYARITLGPFDLEAIGIMAKASAALASGGIPVFVISTYRYDHLLVPLERAEDAALCLEGAGFSRKD